ncbi:MAG: sensor histidine kinase, partial [Halobacteriota archaeon]
HFARTPSRTPIDLSALVTEEVTEIGERFPAATVRTRIKDDVIVLGDSSLQIAVRNLLENAIEHNDSASPTVKIELFTEGTDAVLRIGDDGPGIPDAQQKVIAAGTETPLEHINGLGLWMVVWTVESVAGSIDFESVPEEGTTVECTFERRTEPTDANGNDEIAYRTTRHAPSRNTGK